MAQKFYYSDWTGNQVDTGIEYALRLLPNKVVEVEENITQINEHIDSSYNEILGMFDDVSTHIDASFNQTLNIIDGVESNLNQSINSVITLIDNLTTSDIVTGDIIEVTGTNVGGYKHGDYINLNSTVTDILTDMLTTDIDVSANVPMLVTPGISTQTVEIGTEVQILLNTQYIDGKFTSTKPEMWTTSQNANCPIISGPTVYVNEVEQTEPNNIYLTGNTTIRTVLDYGANLINGVTYLGSTSSSSIDSGTITSISEYTTYKNNYILAVTNTLYNIDMLSNASIRGEETNININGRQSHRTNDTDYHYVLPTNTKKVVLYTIPETYNADLLSIKCNDGRTFIFKKSQDTIYIDGASGAWVGNYNRYVYDFSQIDVTGLILNVYFGDTQKHTVDIKTYEDALLYAQTDPEARVGEVIYLTTDEKSVIVTRTGTTGTVDYMSDDENIKNIIKNQIDVSNSHLVRYDVDGLLESNFTIQRDSSMSYKFIGIDDTVLGEINFPLDAFLTDASLEGNYLVLSFNTESGQSDIHIDMTQLFPYYNSDTSYIDVSNYTIHFNEDVVKNLIESYGYITEENTQILINNVYNEAYQNAVDYTDSQKYTLPTADSITLGGIKIDDESIKITDGIIRVNEKYIKWGTI